MFLFPSAHYVIGCILFVSSAFAFVCVFVSCFLFVRLLCVRSWRRCPLLATFLSVPYCLLSLFLFFLRSCSRLDLVWFGSVSLVTTAGFVADHLNLEINNNLRGHYSISIHCLPNMLKGFRCVQILSCFFFVSWAMSLFQVSCTIAVLFLYGESIMYVFLPNADDVFLPCDHELDFFTPGYVRIQ